MSAALLDLQATIQRHVMGQADALPLIVGDAAHAGQRLGIYANAYRIRLADALADAYEKTRDWMGSERFERGCLRYIAAHPPTTRSLRWFGDRYADALAQWIPAEPWIAELARLDWALRNAFDGPDAPALDGAAMAAIAPESWATLGLLLQPTAQLLDFAHNTVAIWQALDDEVEPPELQRGSEVVTWLVWRKGLQPHFRSLHPIETHLLRSLLAGDSFASACAAAEAASPAAAEGEASPVAEHIGWCLRQWLEDELLSAVIEPAVA